MVGFLYVLLSLTALQVECFSGGGSSIATQCGSMVPDNIHGNTGQSSPSPYTVTVSQTTYQPGDTIQVTLSGTIPFSGFLLEAHEEGKNTAVGTFSLGSGSGIVLVSCNRIAASGVSQSDNQPKRTVTVTWTAPASVSLGNIVVK
ncbi:putative ferric-chelate reductase 1 [Coregonus clupeaformis]|uniref:putative ferric-chelate reductase 1 n=1 Tax=Coregonus clupeaformis TaxID=59861 RepID=UPI001E1C7722|nr:putative ferric-chelate reductase 1 [Coregonus clupeaformis]